MKSQTIKMGVLIPVFALVSASAFAGENQCNLSDAHRALAKLDRREASANQGLDLWKKGLPDQEKELLDVMSKSNVVTAEQLVAIFAATAGGGFLSIEIAGTVMGYGGAELTSVLAINGMGKFIGSMVSSDSLPGHELERRQELDLRAHHAMPIMKSDPGFAEFDRLHREVAWGRRTDTNFQLGKWGWVLDNLVPIKAGYAVVGANKGFVTESRNHIALFAMEKKYIQDQRALLKQALHEGVCSKDDVRSRRIASVRGKEVQTAIDAVLSGASGASAQKSVSLK